MKGLKYESFREYLALETPRERAEWLRRRTAKKKHQRAFATIERMKRSVAVHECSHKKTKTIVAHAGEVDGIALDDVLEVRCTKCGVLVGLEV